MLKTAAAIVLVLSVGFVAMADGKKSAKVDPAKLVGTWTYESGMKSGEKVGKEGLAGEVVITKDTFTLPAGPDMKFVIGYKIDAKASPATIDMEIKDGPVKEGKALGLLTTDGDTFTLCYVPVEDKDTKRPTKVESTKDNKAFLFVLKKK
jgi:uncharacterized protein (TIGR03067 family)